MAPSRSERRPKPGSVGSARLIKLVRPNTTSPAKERGREPASLVGRVEGEGVAFQKSISEPPSPSRPVEMGKQERLRRRRPLAPRWTYDRFPPIAAVEIYYSA